MAMSRDFFTGVWGFPTRHLQPLAKDTSATFAQERSMPVPAPEMNPCAYRTPSKVGNSHARIHSKCHVAIFARA